MARLPVRQEMIMVSVFIMHMMMMEIMFNVLLLLSIVLAIRRMGYKFRRSIKYANQGLSKHNIRSIN